MITVDNVFLDTNIVLRLLNASLPDHAMINAYVGTLRQRQANLWINRQVLREYLVQVTRPGFLSMPLHYP